MFHCLFKENPNNKYKLAILLPQSALKVDNIRKHYLDKMNLNEEDVIAFSLTMDSPKKVTVKTITNYLAQLDPVFAKLGVEMVMVAESAYFKKISGLKKVEQGAGQVLPIKFGFTAVKKVMYVPNYNALFYSPELEEKIDIICKEAEYYLTGKRSTLGRKSIEKITLVQNLKEAQEVFSFLHTQPEVAIDIETIGLDPFSPTFRVLSFALSHDEKYASSFMWLYRELLKDFLKTYKGKTIWHGGTFDIKCIIKSLYPFTYEGFVEGLNDIFRNVEDTMIMSYLATNSTSKPSLKLKDLAFPFLGKWALVDVEDLTDTPISTVMQYNGKDVCATMWLYKQQLPKLIADKQWDIYKQLFLPAMRNVTHMELVGAPLNMNKVNKAEQILINDMTKIEKQLNNLPLIKHFIKVVRTERLLLDNERLKTKTRTMEELEHIGFNPNSDNQLRKLIYDVWGFPVIDKTKSKQPATGAKTLKKLINQPMATKEHVEVFELLIGYGEAAIILNTFISAFQKAELGPEGTHFTRNNEPVKFLRGSFKLGGTVSGRMSSSKPNMQNIPSKGNKYAKIIKECFEAPRGWIFMGADFSSLEDRISALTTKDPNKLKVYTDGFDGHCLRAYSYFGDKMPDIQNTVESINSIETKYPDYRQLSKIPTFALTYNGTYIAIMEQTGLSEEQAKAIEANYHKLYEVSDQWTATKIKEASEKGYTTVAFGLRLRTPILHKTVLNTSSTPYEAQSEARTVGNAQGQSYGLLNNRAANELQARALVSGMANQFVPCMHIHDAQYFLVRDNLGAVEWINNNLIECMEWQDLDAIKHPTVKLGGETSIFYPNWSNETKIPNKATIQEILTIAEKIK